MRMRENAEQIAFYRGEEEENRRFRAAFGAIAHNWRGLMLYSKRVAFTETFYIEAGSFVSYLFTVPRYFAGQLTIGGVMQMNTAFARLRTALSWFLFNYQDLALLRAVLRRLREFDQLLSQQESSNIRVTPAAERTCALAACACICPTAHRCAPYPISLSSPAKAG